MTDMESLLFPFLPPSGRTHTTCTHMHTTFSEEEINEIKLGLYLWEVTNQLATPPNFLGPLLLKPMCTLGQGS